MFSSSSATGVRAKELAQAYTAALASEAAHNVGHDILCSDKCGEACFLHGQKIRHGHYTFAKAPCGLMDQFRKSSADVRFDFRSEDRDAIFREYISKGLIYRAYLPAILFATSKPLAFTPQQAKISP